LQANLLSFSSHAGNLNCSHHDNDIKKLKDKAKEATARCNYLETTVAKCKKDHFQLQAIVIKMESRISILEKELSLESKLTKILEKTAAGGRNKRKSVLSSSSSGDDSDDDSDDDSGDSDSDSGDSAGSNGDGEDGSRNTDEHTNNDKKKNCLINHFNAKWPRIPNHDLQKARIMCPFHSGSDDCTLFSTTNRANKTITDPSFIKTDREFDQNVNRSCKANVCCHKAFTVSKVLTEKLGIDVKLQILNDWNSLMSGDYSALRMNIRQHLITDHQMSENLLLEQYPVLAIYAKGRNSIALPQKKKRGSKKKKKNVKKRSKK